jgi:hypothetical protein
LAFGERLGLAAQILMNEKEKFIEKAQILQKFLKRRKLFKLIKGMVHF